MGGLTGAGHGTTGSPVLVMMAAGAARRYGGCKPLAPVGLHGEAVIDLLVSDAVAAGFGRIVLVLHPETGPAIRYHVEQVWPESVDTAIVAAGRHHSSMRSSLERRGRSGR